MDKKTSNSAHDAEVRKGPWTMEEDLILINYIANNGEGVWNSLAKSAGLKRTGKSCRLRWLNYLRPDVRRGNITPEEQLLIMELHAKWGNRWSKIAKHLPGRTDNEIKNFWRTRIQKHIKQGDQHNGQSSSSDHQMMNYDHQNQATSTSQLSNCSSSADAVDQIPYSPPSSSIYNKQPNMEMQYFANNYYTTSTTITTTTITTPGLLPPPPPPPPHPPSDNYWSMEDIWSMQLLNGD